MGTSEDSQEGMNKRDAEFIVQRTFGPNVEAVRVSSDLRDGRFTVCCNQRGIIQIVGCGPDWESAIDHAKSTELGRRLQEEHAQGVALAEQALKAKSPVEFADAVEQQVISEALSSGASEEAINELRKRFAKAKEKLINDYKDRESEDGTQERKDDESSGDHHEGPGTEGQQERE